MDRIISVTVAWSQAKADTHKKHILRDSQAQYLTLGLRPFQLKLHEINRQTRPRHK